MYLCDRSIWLQANDPFPRNRQPVFLPSVNTSYMLACLSTSHLTWLWERHGNRLAELAAIESSWYLPRCKILRPWFQWYQFKAPKELPGKMFWGMYSRIPKGNTCSHRWSSTIFSRNLIQSQISCTTSLCYYPDDSIQQPLPTFFTNSWW